MAQESICLKICIFFGTYLLTAFANVPLIWGNLSAYTISFFKFRLNQDIGLDSTWIISAYTIAWSFGMFVCDKLTRKLGRLSVIIAGVIISSGGVLVCSQAVQKSFLSLLCALAITCGFGTGILQGSQYVLICAWCPPKYIGRAFCSLYACQQLSSMALNVVITWYVNPTNARPDSFVLNEKLFSQSEVLNRVPNVFIVYGVMLLVSGILATVLVREKRSSGNDENSNNKPRDCGDNDSKSYNEISTEYSTIDKGGLDLNRDLSKNPYNKNHECIVIDEISTEKKISELSEKSVLKAKTDIEQRENESSNEVERSKSKSCDLTPKQALRTRIFYIILVMIVYIDTSFIIINTYFKLFGMLFNPDDYFFATTSVAVNIGIVIFASLSGIACDNFGVKNTIIFLTSGMCVFSGALYLSAQINKWFYFVCIVLYIGSTNSLYLVMPVCCTVYFGKTNGTAIYAMVTSATLLTNTATPPLVRFILSMFDWLALFTTVSVFTLSGLLVVVFGLPPKSGISKN